MRIDEIIAIWNITLSQRRYSHLVKELIFDVLLPEFEGESELLNLEQAKEWIAKRLLIHRHEKTHGENLFIETLHSFSDLFPGITEWDQELKPYQKFTNCILTASICHTFNIKIQDYAN